MKAETAKKLVAENPNASTHTLSRILYSKHKLEFTGPELARNMIRYYRGQIGVNNRRMGRIKKQVVPNKWGVSKLPEPDSDQVLPFSAGQGRYLLLPDIHIPYYDKDAIECALNEGRKNKVDTILFTGDFLDCYMLSMYAKNPAKRNFPGELKLAKQVLEYIKGRFPKARMIFMHGNHEERYWNMVANRLPELFCDTDVQNTFSLAGLLDFEKYGIEEVTPRSRVLLGKLSVIHGHEYRVGIAAPVNPARGLFLRAKDCAIQGDRHQTSEHTEQTIGRKLIGTWSMGCLCGLSPHYMPYNSWNHGFAIVEVSPDDNFHVQNRRILNGHLL